MPADQLIHGYVANEETYEDQTPIIEEGRKGVWVYAILEGRAVVKKRTPKGIVTVARLTEGDLFGEMGLFERGAGLRSASVVADGPIRVGVLDNDRLLRDYEKLSPQLKGLIKAIIIRLDTLTNIACELALQ
jgi:CRP-like cAMP-binding protein